MLRKFIFIVLFREWLKLIFMFLCKCQTYLSKISGQLNTKYLNIVRGRISDFTNDYIVVKFPRNDDKNDIQRFVQTMNSKRDEIFP